MDRVTQIISLSAHRRPERTKQTKTTSINLEARHLKYVQDRRINLSSLVRALLERLISDEETAETPSEP